MPSEPAIRKKYSLNWAGQVVEQLRKRYPRATDYVLALYGLTITNLAFYLACGDDVFNYLKKRIKYVGHVLERDGVTPQYVEKYSPERTFIAKFAQNSTRKRLDSRLDSTYAQGAGSEGLVSDQSKAAGGDLPSGFFQFFLFPEEMGSLGEVCEV